MGCSYSLLLCVPEIGPSGEGLRQIREAHMKTWAAVIIDNRSLTVAAPIALQRDRRVATIKERWEKFADLHIRIVPRNPNRNFDSLDFRQMRIRIAEEDIRSRSSGSEALGTKGRVRGAAGRGLGALTR